MNEEQRALLNEYEAWRAVEENLPLVVDVSVEAFLKEKDAEANARRVQEALEIIGGADHDELPEDFIPTRNALQYAHDTIDNVRHILIDNRPYVSVNTLAEPSRLEFT